jgi:hypothetical protein
LRLTDTGTDLTDTEQERRAIIRSFVAGVIALDDAVGRSPALIAALQDIASMTPALAAQTELNIAMQELHAANSNNSASQHEHVEQVPSTGRIRADEI